MKIKRVNRSNTPNIRQMQNMTDNLVTREGIHYANIELSCTNYGHRLSEPAFTIAIQPGIAGEVCSIHQFNTWAECQDFYFEQLSKPAK